jgi:hypothetical protein
MDLRLSSEHALRWVTVPFTLAVFLIRVLDGYVFIHQILSIHICDCIVRGLEIGIRHKTIAFREPVFRVASDLGRGDKGAKAGECIIEGFLINHGVQVANEELGPNFYCFLLVR